MTIGTVKFFNRSNHYGFIDGEDGKSYFVHESGLASGTSIDEGDKVSFDAIEGDKGPKAENVKKQDSSAEEAPAEEVEAEPNAESEVEAEAEEAPAEEPKETA